MKSVLTACLICVWCIFWTAMPVCSDGITIQEGVGEHIPFATGGIGQSEQDKLHKMAHQYNLKLVFAAMSGAYLTDVEVVIQNSQNQTVLDRRFSGPLVYTKLPQGSYQITASHHGLEKTRQVNVGTNLKEVLFHWHV